MWRKQADLSQTIFSRVSGSLPSAVAILRLSGPSAFSIIERIFLPGSDKKSLRERGMVFGELVVESDHRKIDDVLLLTFVGPESFTGEDVVEIQCHGSLPIVHRIEEELIRLGARPAERGEFSYRAFLHGKFSAMELEGLGDLFRAQQFRDIEKIYSRTDGSLDISIARLRRHLVQVQAIFDTAVDFSEEYSAVLRSVDEPLSLVTRECSAIIQRYESFSEVGQIPRLVIAGKPNAGKSSLFNALLCRYRAIVNERPGTTRDVIEEDLEIGGRRWKLVDTAGLRDPGSQMEKEGISLGADFLRASTFWILVCDGTEEMSEREKTLLSEFARIPHFVVRNKRDLPDWVGHEEAMPISAKTGEGIPELWARLKLQLSQPDEQDALPLPTATQVARLRFVMGELEKLRHELSQDTPPEFLAERTRLISEHLAGVVGEITGEDILDRVFSTFCIGK